MEKVLPELLEMIFRFLDPEDIENAANVCRSWHQIIASSTPLMKKLTFELDFADKHQELPVLPYRNVKFWGLSDESVVPIDPNQVQKLRLQNSLSTSGMKFLMQCQNLTTLVIRGVSVVSTAKINLPNLSYLDCFYFVLPLIKSHKVKVLKLAQGGDSWNQKASRKFRKFLMTCDNLKHLIFSGLCSNQIMILKNQLESLEIVNCRTIPNYFKRVFESQQLSLKYLHLEIFELDDEISDYIYRDMNLEKIIDSRKRRDGMQEPTAVKIKNLALNYVLQNFAFVQRLLACCHDLEILNIGLPEGKELELLQVISQLSKLKHLKLREWSNHDRIEFNLQFPQLEELILPSDRFTSIVYGCPKLKRLEFKTFEAPTKSEFERIFASCPDIEEIYLGYIGDVSEEALNALKFADSKEIKIECQSEFKCKFEKLMKLKNGTIVNFNAFRSITDIDDEDFFILGPKLITELYGFIIDFDWEFNDDDD